jgi:hypothetical protein
MDAIVLMGGLLSHTDTRRSPNDWYWHHQNHHFFPSVVTKPHPIPLLYSIEKDTFEELKEWKLPIEVTRGMIIDLGDFDGLIIIERPPTSVLSFSSLHVPAKSPSSTSSLSSSSSRSRRINDDDGDDGTVASPQMIVGRRCWYVSYSSLCSKQLPLSSWQLLPHLFPSLDPSTATAV